MKTLSELISTGKLVGSRGASFRRTSTSKPDDWKDHSGKDVGAMRNFAHEKAAVAKAAASKSERESIVNKRNKDAAQRAKETLRMAKEGLDEAKGKFVYDKPLKAHVDAMDKHSTDALKGMHSRWSGDHKDMKSNPAHSERLLAVHHVLKKRGESVPDLPQHKNLGTVKRFTAEAVESTGTEARTKIKNVARPDDAPPTSEKSLLARNGEIKVKKVDEEIAAAISRKYGLTDSILEAARAVMEKKTQVDLDPTTDDKEDNGDNDDDDDVKKESKHTTPKSDKEKKLAALAHPKDKITHKDVLVGRGVLKKEDVDVDSLTEEQLEEVLKKSDPAGTWVKDFVHSKDPKFAGKSKKERMKMALGAYYAKQRNEEVEEEQLNELSPKKLRWYSKKAYKQLGKIGLGLARRAGKDPHGPRGFSDKDDNIVRKRAQGIQLINRKIKRKELDPAVIDEQIEGVDEAIKPYVSYSAGGVGKSPSATVMAANEKPHKTFTKAEHGHDYKQKAMDYFKKHGNKLKEEEQLDELSPATLKSYEKGAKKDVKHARDDIAYQNRMYKDFGARPDVRDSQKTIAKRTKGIELAKAKTNLSGRSGITRATIAAREEVEFSFSEEEIERIEAIAAQLDEAKPTVVSAPIRGANQDQSGFGVKSNTADYTISDSKKVKVKEEAELDEARGRPKKSGDAPEGDDTGRHPIQQLHKIATGIQGSEPHFEHKDGSKTKVSKQLAKHITAVYGSMRTTQDKEDFANKLHANRQSMMSAVDKHVR